MSTNVEDLLCLAQSWADLAGSTLHFRSLLTPVDIVVNKHAGLLAAAFELFDLVVSAPEGLAAARAMGFLPADAEPVQQSGLADVAHDAGHPAEHEGRDGKHQPEQAVAQSFFSGLFGQLFGKQAPVNGGRKQLQSDNFPVIVSSLAPANCPGCMASVDQFRRCPPVCPLRLSPTQHP